MANRRYVGRTRVSEALRHGTGHVERRTRLDIGSCARVRPFAWIETRNPVTVKETRNGPHPSRENNREPNREGSGNEQGPDQGIAVESLTALSV